jgi:uncharacterized lipoprotein
MLCCVLIQMISCSSDSSRYRDNASLEKPPEVIVKQSDTNNDIAPEQEEIPFKRHGKGLKSDVFRHDESIAKLSIKRPFDQAWLLLSQAIQINELKVTDQDRSHGEYYVAFDNRGILSQATSFFGEESNKTTYLIKVEEADNLTTCRIQLARKEEQSASSDKNGEQFAEGAMELTEKLFDTLQNDVKEE